MRSDVNIYIKRDKCYVCGIRIERCIMDNLRMYLAPCRQACPIHMNCQGYVRLIAQGKEEEAAKEMRKDLPFSGIVGRVCTHPCEEKCERRKEDNQPVHIRALKRYLADSRPDIGFEPGLLPNETGKRVAIVGSGPAGLMAAYELAAKGHGVTVFDSALPGLGELVEQVGAALVASQPANAYEAEIARAVERVAAEQLMALAASADMPQVRAIATFYLQQAKGRLDRAAGSADVAAAAHAGLLSRDISRFLDNPEAFKRPAPIVVPPGTPIGEPDAAWLDMFRPPCSLCDAAVGGVIRR